MQLSPVVVALDYEDQRAALNLVSQLDPALCRLKVGKEMFSHFGLILCVSCNNVILMCSSI